MKLSTLLGTKSTKTEVYKSALQVDIYKNRNFLRSYKTVRTHKNGYVFGMKHCEKIETKGVNSFSSIAVSDVNPQKLILYLDFCTEAKQCERLTDIYNSG